MYKVKTIVLEEALSSLSELRKELIKRGASINNPIIKKSDKIIYILENNYGKQRIS